jgi:hypothetical protein
VRRAAGLVPATLLLTSCAACTLPPRLSDEEEALLRATRLGTCALFGDGDAEPSWWFARSLEATDVFTSVERTEDAAAAGAEWELTVGVARGPWAGAGCPPARDLAFFLTLGLFPGWRTGEARVPASLGRTGSTGWRDVGARWESTCVRGWIAGPLLRLLPGWGAPEGLAFERRAARRIAVEASRGSVDAQSTDARR